MTATQQGNPNPKDAGGTGTLELNAEAEAISVLDTYWPPDPATAPIPNSVPFHLTDPVNLAQLNSELGTALGYPVQSVLVGPYEDGGSILWVTPPSVDPAIVQATIDAHVPDPNWGQPDTVDGYDAVLAKITADPNAQLTPEEVAILAAGNALRINPPI